MEYSDIKIFCHGHPFLHFALLHAGYVILTKKQTSAVTGCSNEYSGRSR